MDFKEYMDLPEANENCELCNGEGEVQVCSGEHYGENICDCVMVKHYKSEKYLNLKMAKMHQGMLDYTIKMRNI